MTAEQRLPAANHIALGLLILGLCGWPYLAPADYWPWFGWNSPATRDFTSLWGFATGPLPGPDWQTGFVVLLLAASALHLWCLRQDRMQRLPGVWVASVATGVICLATVLSPPAASCDTYGYAAYGRMIADHQLNPYTTTQFALGAWGDPIGPYLQWDVVSPYGALWSAASALLAGLLHDITAVVIAFKAVAAAALLLCARELARLSQLLYPARPPGTAFLAVAMQPLLVFEAAGNGHNDFVMLLPLLMGFRHIVTQRWIAAAALISVAASIKFVAAIALPWVFARAMREGASARTLGLMVALPCLIMLMPEWTLFDGQGPLAGTWNHLTAHPGSGMSKPLPWILLATAAYLLATYRAVNETAEQPLRSFASAALAIIVCLTPGWPWYFSWAMITAAIWATGMPGLFITTIATVCGALYALS